MTSKARAKNWHISSLDGLKPSELEKIAYGLSEIQAEVALHDWSKHARPEQIAPEGNWAQWLFLAGRGAGKTRAGSEWVRSMVRAGFKRGAMIAPTASDARDVMVEGSSGILDTAWKYDQDIHGKEIGVPEYEPTKRRVRWANGAMVTTFSAEEPDRLRGPQHEFLWCDELAAWQNASDAWDMAMLGLRIGSNPRCMISTTPRPIPLIRELLRLPTCVTTVATTYDNVAYLAPSFFDRIIQKYEGTRLGSSARVGWRMASRPAFLCQSDAKVTQHGP